MRLTTVFSLLLATVTVVAGEHWPQASGPQLNWKAEGPEPPMSWSVSDGTNVLWRTTLPEGGQSAVTVWGKRAFVTTHKPMQETSDRLEPNIIGYCLDATTGEILWNVSLPGTDPVQTAGIFSDATTFAPICDGEHVWFFNRCGSMGCYDLEGNQVWLREFQPRTRHTNRQCEPILVGDLIITVEVRNKEAGQKLLRHKPVPAGIDPRDVWTYLHAINKNTGRVVWIGEAGTCVHNTPMVGRLADGRWAIAHGRGGGHGPLEKPYGVTLTLLETGKSLWNLEVNGDCSWNSHWNSNFVFWFDKQNHLVIDTTTGKLLRSQRLDENVDVTDAQTGARELGTSLHVGKRMPLTNQTNIVVDRWHYFLAHDVHAIGRVNIETGKTEYLRVPVQTTGASNSQRIWDLKDAISTDTTNSRGIDIALDKRAKGTGWGHVSAASPILVNRHLYIPIMNGTVYVVDAHAEIFDERALVAVNDLGPPGATWTLASFSYADGRLWMHTMKEVICIGTPDSIDY
ncbi:outer membrane protein assembly factor BamB family protein [Neorhodopirellula pilleata]|uniref:PQQ enzyme repeat protein n=1 Tax=Neorhodopirellula pilleata TaxID=2714738 RepID=A0A5C6ARG7_9BACT|nr:PQQ-binding-like beta-propeller repeat protein [Neorhodopirellula pilleata]TWU01582.1 PQQ enzyme repeat protein [Neorhodopirellula pilleata]